MDVQAKPLDLRLYLDLLFRNRWWVLVAMIIGGIAAGIVAYVSPKIYESKSTVLVEDDDMLRTLTRSMAVAPSLTSKMQFLEQRQDLAEFPAVGAWQCVITDHEVIGATTM